MRELRSVSIKTEDAERDRAAVAEQLGQLRWKCSESEAQALKCSVERSALEGDLRAVQMKKEELTSEYVSMQRQMKEELVSTKLRLEEVSGERNTLSGSIRALTLRTDDVLREEREGTAQL
eukprot:1959173-Amphidinium_carterae.1